MTKLLDLLIIFIVLMIFTLFQFGCATNKGSIISTFEGINRVPNTQIIKFQKVIVLEEIYPPASKVCNEYYQINDDLKQCMELLDLNTYLTKNYPKCNVYDQTYDLTKFKMIFYLNCE